MIPDIRFSPKNHTKLGDLFQVTPRKNLNLPKNYPLKLGVVFIGSYGYPKKMLDIRLGPAAKKWLMKLGIPPKKRKLGAFLKSAQKTWI